jgi:hypothetical protein
MSYPVENIPDGDLLFKWIPRNRLDPDGRPDPGVFSDKGIGMSTNWSRYCTAEECRAGCSRPNSVGVVSLHAQKVRALPQEVRHTPKTWPKLPKQAQAHTDVIGAKDPEVQVKLARLAKTELRPGPK